MEIFDLIFALRRRVGLFFDHSAVLPEHAEIPKIVDRVEPNEWRLARSRRQLLEVTKQGVAQQRGACMWQGRSC